MAKVVVLKRSAAKGTNAAAKTPAVGEKRVRDAAGKILTVRTLDAQSKTFAKDLTYVFQKNVAKARRENKQVTGTLDRVPAKG
jgi:hypothetical protein